MQTNAATANKVDIFGHTQNQAIKLCEQAGAGAYGVLSFIRGLWVVTHWVYLKSGFKGAKYPSYAVLNRSGKLVHGIGNRSETIKYVLSKEANVR